MYCRKCGFQLLDNAKFCSKCGTPVISINSEELPKEEPSVMDINDDVPDAPAASETDMNETVAEPIEAVKPVEATDTDDIQPAQIEEEMVEVKPVQLAKEKVEVKPAVKPAAKPQSKGNNKKIIIIAAVVVLAILWLVAMIFIVKNIVSKGAKKAASKVEELVAQDNITKTEVAKTVDNASGDEGSEAGDDSVQKATPKPTSEPTPEITPEPTPEPTPTPWPEWSFDTYGEELSILQNVDDYKKCMSSYRKYSPIKGYTFWTVKTKEYEAVNVIRIDAGCGINELRNSDTTRTYYGGGIYYVEEEYYGMVDEYYFSEGRLFECFVDGYWHTYGEEGWEVYNDRAELFIRERGDAMGRINF